MKPEYLNDYFQGTLIQPSHLENLVRASLFKISIGKSLTFEEIVDTFRDIQDFSSSTNPRATYEQVVAWFAYFSLKQLSPLEIAALCAGTLKYQHDKLVIHGSKIISTSGSGGDRMKTVNVSSPASIVTAACGVPVAKHGAGKVTGISGSTDWFRSQKVNYMISPQSMIHVLEKVGLGYFEFVASNPYGVLASRLLTPNYFEFVGPMVDPVEVHYKVIGAKDLKQQALIQESFKQLFSKGFFKSIKRVEIPCGSDGNGNFLIDEVSSLGPTKIVSVTHEHTSEYTVVPSDFGLAERYEFSDIAMKKNSRENIEATTLLFENRATNAIRDLILVNSALHLFVAKSCDSLKEAYVLARKHVENGSARKVLTDFVRETNRPLK